MSDANMSEGVVEFYNDTGGYGFIETDDSDEDIFFHVQDFEDSLRDPEEGDEVRFTIEKAEKGPRVGEFEYLDE